MASEKSSLISSDIHRGYNDISLKTGRGISEGFCEENFLAIIVGNSKEIPIGKSGETHERFF